MLKYRSGHFENTFRLFSRSRRFYFSNLLGPNSGNSVFQGNSDVVSATEVPLHFGNSIPGVCNPSSKFLNISKNSAEVSEPRLRSQSRARVFARRLPSALKRVFQFRLGAACLPASCNNVYASAFENTPVNENSRFFRRFQLTCNSNPEPNTSGREFTFVPSLQL